MLAKNIGRKEQYIRILLGVLILGLGYYYKNLWGLVGLIPLITGLVRYCPLYTLLGMNTNKKD